MTRERIGAYKLGYLDGSTPTVGCRAFSDVADHVSATRDTATMHAVWQHYLRGVHDARSGDLVQAVRMVRALHLDVDGAP